MLGERRPERSPFYETIVNNIETLIDPLAEVTIATLSDWIVNQSHDPSRVYLLIDGSVDPSLRQKIDRIVPPEARALVFAGHAGAGDDTLALSPLLVNVRALVVHQTAHQSVDRIGKICRLASGLPVLSVLESSASLSEIAAHLRVYVTTSCADSGFVLRFADTRVLPNLVRAMTSEQRDGFLGATSSWTYVSRSGELLRLPCPSLNVPAQPLELSDEQFIQVLDASEPDTILDRLCRAGTSCAKLAPSKQYEEVRRLLAEANQAGVQAEADRVVWCQLGIEVRQDQRVLARWPVWVERITNQTMTIDELIAEAAPELQHA
jgi:Domain of unknown function (DUF4123)